MSGRSQQDLLALQDRICRLVERYPPLFLALGRLLESSDRSGEFQVRQGAHNSTVKYSLTWHSTARPEAGSEPPLDSGPVKML